MLLSGESKTILIGKTMLPSSQRPNKIPLPTIGFILACLVLAAVLVFATWHNLDREEGLMEKFLLSESQTLIRVFEAGARTSMMMEARGGNLGTLVEETVREETVAYILIIDENGRLLASAGDSPAVTDLPPTAKVLDSTGPLTRMISTPSGAGAFEVAQLFSPLQVMPMHMGMMDRMGMMNRWQNWCGNGKQKEVDSCREVIYLGLYTKEFDAARDEDVKQSLVMLAILFLLGSGGLYGLLLTHKTKVAKAALENMELYTDNLIRSMPAGLISIDTERKIVSVNKNARELFARDEADMIGKTLQQLTEPEECPLAPLLRAKQEFVDQPMECLRQDGEAIPLKASASHLRDRDGNLRGMVLILRDQRQIRAMEEALERSRRHAALGRMAAGIAHEIRNPLGTLRGFAQYFSRNDSQDAKAREYADLMVGEVDRLNRTVSALLQFSRPREPDMTEVDLCALAQRAITFLQADADSQQVELRLNLPEPCITLKADADLLQQVLLNLMQNSLAATTAKGEIELGAQLQADTVQLWVRDSGKGLSAEEQARMFDPFFTTRKEGTGLGLAVVQQIVEQHRGRIDVESVEGEWTCVTLVLPRTGIRSQNGGNHEQA
jgi:two-component system sensor histidine kinase HydH